MITLDTETTGLDLNHSSRPFFITTCTDDGQISYWEWNVDPLTRIPYIPQEDLAAIGDLLFVDGDRGPIGDTSWGDGLNGGLILQNPKFDFAALRSIGFWDDWDIDQVWTDVRDTLMAGHLLASNHPHDLGSMAVEYVGVDISPLEVALNKAVEECRRYCRSHLPDWRIAKEGMFDLPSASNRLWANDTWLPRALAKHLGHPDDHPWFTVLSDYANGDSAITGLIWQRQLAEIRRRKLSAIYKERLKLLPIAYEMERRGVSLSEERLNEIMGRYERESYEAGQKCREIAASYNHVVKCKCDAGAIQGTSYADRKTGPVKKSRPCKLCEGRGSHVFELDLPAGASPNNSLRTFFFDILKVEQIKGHKSKTSAPTLDKSAMLHYSVTLPEGEPPHTFVKTLLAKRSRDTAISYMTSYKKFQLPSEHEGYHRLHPNLNPTGTATLRWSSNNPNEQNISKREGFNLRYSFGPLPGREWWSMDAQNIELRIPAYESGEEALIALFEQSDASPFYGSNHMLVFSILWPELWAKAIEEVGLDGAAKYCKKKYADTYYQWTKNGNFAVQYGAIDREDGTGTADRAYHQKGAHAKIKAKFSKLTALNDKCIKMAERLGYVETIPDRTVDPDRGYPLLCTRTERGQILPTVPLNYHVQSTAMQWTSKAMIRCDEQLRQWRRETSHTPSPFDAFLVMQVHDECVFDFPKRAHPKTNPKASNLARIRVIQGLMEKGGQDIGIPTPVGIEYHENNWSEGVTI